MREARIARAERARAERRFNDVRKLSNTLIFDVQDAFESQPGMVDTRRKVVSLGLQYLDRLAADAAGGDIALRREIADGYTRIADIQGRQGVENLGDTAAAIASYKKAVQIQEHVVSSGAAVTEDRTHLSALYLSLGHAMLSSGDFRAALDYDRKALFLLQQIKNENPSAFKRENSLGVATLYVALDENAGDPQASLNDYAKALAIFQEVAASKEGHSIGKYNLALTYLSMASALSDLTQYEQARDAADKSLGIRKLFYKYNRSDPRAQLDLAESFAGLGDPQLRQGQLHAALSNYRESLKLAKVVVAQDSKDQRAKEVMAAAALGLSGALRRQGKLSAALTYGEQAMEISATMASADPINAGDQDQLAQIYAAIGDIYYARGSLRGSRPQEQKSDLLRAIGFYQKANDIYSKLRSRGALRFSSISESQRMPQEISRYQDLLANR